MRITKVLNSTKEAKITKLIKQNVIVDFDKNQEIDGFTIDFLGSLKRDEELFVSLLENDYSITNIFKAKEDEANDSIEYAELFYLDYVNNYLSIDRMCEDYYISTELANQLIRVGRMVNNNK